MWLVVDGHGTPEERVIGVHGRGRFLGELSLLTGEVSFYTAVAADDGEVLVVPVDRLRGLIAGDPAFGDLVLRAYLLRRSILIGLGAGLRIVGSRYSPDARRLRDFAARNRLPCRWLDLEADPAAEALLRQAGVTPEETPIVIAYGRLLRNPSNAELAAAVGLPAPGTLHAGSDLVVVGAGPAGLSAGVYGASEGMRTVILDSTATGGQAGTSSRIENYLGFPSGISGAELAERAVLQARKFGATFAVPAQATAIARDGGNYTIGLGDGTSVTAGSVVIATGASYRRLDVPRLEFFEQMSVYYAASQAEALLCRGDPVAIVGGGNSAGQATVFLSRHAARVTLIVREPDLSERHVPVPHRPDRAAGERPGAAAHRGAGTARRSGAGGRRGRGQPDRGAEHRRGTGPVRVHRRRSVHRMAGRPGRPGRPWIRADGRNGPASGAADRADGRDTGWQPSVLETSQPGIFAVGDVRSGSAKRVAAAVGEGAIAIRLAFERARAD